VIWYDHVALLAASHLHANQHHVTQLFRGGVGRSLGVVVGVVMAYVHGAVLLS